MKPSIGFMIAHEGSTYEGFLYPADNNDPPLTFNVVTKTNHTIGRMFYGDDENWRLESKVIPNPDRLRDIFEDLIRRNYD